MKQQMRPFSEKLQAILVQLKRKSGTGESEYNDFVTLSSEAIEEIQVADADLRPLSLCLAQFISCMDSQLHDFQQLMVQITVLP